MSLDTATAAEVAAVVTLAVLIVAIVAASAGACGGRVRAAVHDVELAALGEGTLMTYEQASRAARVPPRQQASSAEEKEEPRERCALCLSEYAAAGELVRVVPACGHFFQAECGVDGWLQKRGTCRLYRGGVRALPRPECPPLPPRPRGAP